MFPAHAPDMLIRATQHACFVVLRNGLTLELSYDTSRLAACGRADEVVERRLPLQASHGVWIYGEEVLLEVEVGQA